MTLGAYFRYNVIDLRKLGIVSELGLEPSTFYQIFYMFLLLYPTIDKESK